MRPTFSVLVPVYNGAETIGDALRSLLAQDEPVEEIVVSDDGSDDALDDALRPFPGVLLVRGDNAGLAVARNRAAAVASGEFLALLDADDVWLPGRARALRDAAVREPDLDIITTDAYVVREGRRDGETYYSRRTWAAEEQALAILRSNFIFGAAAIRREAFQRVGGYDTSARFAEDWDLWIRMLTSGSRAGLVGEPLYEYRRRDGSLTRRRVELALGVLDTLDRAAALPLSAPQRRTLARTRGAWLARAAGAAAAAHDVRARRLAVAALVHRRTPAGDRLAALRQLLRKGRQAPATTVAPSVRR